MGRQSGQHAIHSRPRELRSLSAFDNLRHGSVAGLGKHCKINHHGWILWHIAAIVKGFRCCFFATFCCFSATLSTPVAINSYSLSMRPSAQPGYYPFWIRHYTIFQFFLVFLIFKIHISIFGGIWFIIYILFTKYFSDFLCSFILFPEGFIVYSVVSYGDNTPFFSLIYRYN